MPLRNRTNSGRERTLIFESSGKIEIKEHKIDNAEMIKIVKRFRRIFREKMDSIEFKNCSFVEAEFLSAILHIVKLLKKTKQLSSFLFSGKVTLDEATELMTFFELNNDCLQKHIMRENDPIILDDSIPADIKEKWNSMLEQAKLKLDNKIASTAVGGASAFGTSNTEAVANTPTMGR